MKKLFLTMLLLSLGATCKADPLQWSLPYGIGTVQLPTDFSKAIPLAGYDILQRKAIVGAATSLLTIKYGIDGYVGLVGDFHTQAPNAQPYIALGINLLRYIPTIPASNLELHGFGRWTTDSGGSFESHLGAGLSLAYKFI